MFVFYVYGCFKILIEESDVLFYSKIATLIIYIKFDSKIPCIMQPKFNMHKALPADCKPLLIMNFNFLTLAGYYTIAKWPTEISIYYTD